MKSSLLIKNGHIWSAHDDYYADIFICDGKISAIGRGLEGYLSAAEVIDASDLYVFPGGIDAHTHMELPFMGTYAADDFESGTLAGLHGGTTAILDFAIQTQGDSLNSCIQHWHEKAQGKALSDYGFHCGVTDFNSETKKEIPQIMKQGITSFKTFMAYKGALMIDDAMMYSLMQEVRNLGGLVTVHAENGDIITKMTEELLQEGHSTPKYHALAHTPAAEAEACARVMDLAHLSGANLYIVHTSCEEAVRRIQRNFCRDQRVFVETCVQYLILDESLYEQADFHGAKYVLSPPLRKKADQNVLWKSLQAGHIQTVATDHCPFNFCGQKDLGKDDFSKIPNGIAGIEHRLELVFSEGVRKNRISMQRYIEVMCSHPANIFGMKNKGSIAIGKDADIVLFDPKQRHHIRQKTHHHNVDYSAYEGFEVQGKVKTVISNGMVVIRDEKVDQLEKGAGSFVPREPFPLGF